jgi:hypothetical protein
MSPPRTRLQTRHSHCSQRSGFPRSEAGARGRLNAPPGGTHTLTVRNEGNHTDLELAGRWCAKAACDAPASGEGISTARGRLCTDRSGLRRASRSGPMGSSSTGAAPAGWIYCCEAARTSRGARCCPGVLVRRADRYISGEPSPGLRRLRGTGVRWRTTSSCGPAEMLNRGRPTRIGHVRCCPETGEDA